MSTITIFVLIVSLALGALLSVCSTIATVQSREEVYGDRPSLIAIILKVVFWTAFSGLTAVHFSKPWLYIIIILILAVLQLLNREGARRAVAWNYLILLNTLLLLLSIAGIFDSGKTVKVPVMVLMLIPSALAFVIGVWKVAMLDKYGAAKIKTKVTKTTKTEKANKSNKATAEADPAEAKTGIGTSIIAWVIIAILAVAVFCAAAWLVSIL